MKFLKWFKSDVYGAAIGAICLGFVGFSWGGWMTGSSADRMASAMARERVIAAMVPGLPRPRACGSRPHRSAGDDQGSIDLQAT